MNYQHTLLITGPAGPVGGRIVETEAYLGLEDPSCHSFHGQITPRAEVFYRPAGQSYVYLIYGMYHCFNWITGNKNKPEAILIRALEPTIGIESMKELRPKSSFRDLCRGPGRLCKALSITKTHNDLPWNHSSAQMLDTPSVSFSDIECSKRVGLNAVEDSSQWPLRFYEKNSPYVSPH